MSEESARSHRLREVVLNVGAMVGVMSILLAATALAFGITPLIFRSGSMAPAVHTGDLGIAQTVPAADLRVGDVVTVFTSGGVRVTHRIVVLDQTDSGVLLVLKGDANDDPDPEQYAVTEAERLLFAVPRAGYVASWLSGPGGVFLGGLLVGLVLLVLLRRPSGTPPAGRRRSDAAARAGVVALGAVLVAVPLVAHPHQVESTLAAWNDTVDVTGVSTTGYTVPAPVIASCDPTSPGLSGSTRHVTYTWPGVVSPATSYAVQVQGITTSGITVTGTTTKSVDIAYSASLFGGNRSKYATVTVTPTVAGPWSGPVDRSKFLTSGSTAAATCGEADSPEVAFVAPDATTRTVSGERAFITASCTTDTLIACGTYVDDSTVTVTYTLRRVVSGTTRCWTGSWSNTAQGGACTTFQAAETAPSGGQTAWYESGNQSTVYASAGVYTLTVRATDSWANATTVAETFTLQ